MFLFSRKSEEKINHVAVYSIKYKMFKHETVVHVLIASTQFFNRKGMQNTKFQKSVTKQRVNDLKRPYREFSRIVNSTQ